MLHVLVVHAERLRIHLNFILFLSYATLFILITLCYSLFSEIHSLDALPGSCFALMCVALVSGKALHCSSRPTSHVLNLFYSLPVLFCVAKSKWFWVLIVLVETVLTSYWPFFHWFFVALWCMFLRMLNRCYSLRVTTYGRGPRKSCPTCTSSLVRYCVTIYSTK